MMSCIERSGRACVVLSRKSERQFVAKAEREGKEKKKKTHLDEFNNLMPKHFKQFNIFRNPSKLSNRFRRHHRHILRHSRHDTINLSIILLLLFLLLHLHLRRCNKRTPTFRILLLHHLLPYLRTTNPNPLPLFLNLSNQPLSSFFFLSLTFFRRFRFSFSCCVCC